MESSWYAITAKLMHYLATKTQFVSSVSSAVRLAYAAGVAVAVRSTEENVTIPIAAMFIRITFPPMV